MGWLRNNVVAGAITALLVAVVSGVWALPIRLEDVERNVVATRERHDVDLVSVRARHASDVDGLAARQLAAERIDDSVVSMLETVQRQIVSVQHLVEAQIALEARAQGLTPKAPASTGDGG